jgi:tetratricopeptide (TPR) repeat protein
MNLKISSCLGRHLLLVGIMLIMTPCFVIGSEMGMKYADQAYRLLIEGKVLPAVLNYRRAISEGLNDPSIMRNMAIAFYNLRMLDEAIEYMEMGVEASPMDPNLLSELGILYWARGELQKATSMLQKSLQLDPGQGEAYLYLGFSLMRQGKTNLAWQAARIGEKLHYNQDLLLEKLLRLREPEPKHYPFQDPAPIIALRQIILDSEEQGENLVAKWQRGESLQEFFLGGSTAAGRSDGGYIGAFTDTELKPEILAAISGSNIYDQPVIVKTGGTYLLVQRIWPFDPIYWSEPEKQRIVDEPAKHFPPVAFPKTFDSLPSQVASKAELGAEDPFKLEEVDPQKIRLYSGSYHQKERAIEQVVDLRAQGFFAYYLMNRRGDGQTLFNVIAGEYSSREEALKAKKKLLEKGFESFLGVR